MKNAETDFKNIKPAKLQVGQNPKIATADACSLKLAAASVMALSAMMLLN